MKKRYLFILTILLFSCADRKPKENNNDVRAKESLKQVKDTWIDSKEGDSIKQLLFKDYPFPNVGLANLVFEAKHPCCSSPSIMKRFIKYAKIRSNKSNWKIKNKSGYFEVISLQKKEGNHFSSVSAPVGKEEFYERKKAEEYIITAIWKNQIEANTIQVLFNKEKYKIKSGNWYRFKKWLSEQDSIYIDD